MYVFCRMSYSMASHHHFSVDCHLVVYSSSLPHIPVSAPWSQADLQQKMPFLAFPLPLHYYIVLMILIFLACVYNVCFVMPCTFCEWISILVYIYIYTELIFTQSNARVPSCCRFLVLIVNGFPSLFIYILVGTRDLRTLWRPLVSLNLIHVLVFFRNFYPARLQEFFLLFHYLLLSGWRTWMDGWRDGWMERTTTTGQTKDIIYKDIESC